MLWSVRFRSPHAPRSTGTRRSSKNSRSLARRRHVVAALCLSYCGKCSHGCVLDGDLLSGPFVRSCAVMRAPCHETHQLLDFFFCALCAATEEVLKLHVGEGLELVSPLCAMLSDRLPDIQLTSCNVLCALATKCSSYTRLS